MKTLKIASLFAMSLLLAFSVSAQKDKSKRPSPPAQVSQEVDGTKITIDYSRPSKRGREIFGGLEDYGKVWRTGANESTWIEVSSDVKVEGKPLAAGKYGLFTIPGEDEWTIIFNKKWDGWGAYEYKEEDDVLRVKVKPTSVDGVVEMFTIDIDNNGDVSLAWDQTQVTFSIR
ncbi:DUF2911 domain-containing protein [Ekhidna sp. MALMAid0563]|uniref:DUF2911 domain-containing protein n=1 Tax=Ekhidna sp. MALMAid0563 TaxID=3143937 RepID=UPI0032DE36FD